MNTHQLPKGVPAHTGAWLRPLRNWPQTLRERLAVSSAVVRVVVAEVKGSAPREPGSSMLIDAAGVCGTIGGGHLEFQAIEDARAFLSETPPAGRVRRWVLARELGQCCGGVVTVWMERYTRSDAAFVDSLVDAANNRDAVLTSVLTEGRLRRHVSRSGSAFAQRAHLQLGDDLGTLREKLGDTVPPVWIFGAGHVGQAFVRMASELPVAITWIDSRRELLPMDTPREIVTLCVDDPVAALESAPRETRYLVMTHDHELDYTLCRTVLTRGDYAWLGVIGSQSKAARFRSRLARDGIAAERIAELVSPVGVDGIASKWPAAIAVAVAAQLLQQLGRAAERTTVATPCDGNCAQCGTKMGDKKPGSSKKGT
jgi:xanthine dehydrogenase accessory factor